MPGLEHDPQPGSALIVASVSGGKDSTAMALHLKEQGHDVRCVFADTGWEDKQTYDYIRDVLPKHLGPIDWVKTSHTFDDEREQIAQEFEVRLGHYSPMIRACLRKRIMPSRLRRWCTSDLKVAPLKKYMRAIDDFLVNAVGIRAEESRARSKMPRLEWSSSLKLDVWRPILHWKLQDVIDIHKRHDLPPNPKYLQGAERVGCWPCIYARKSEIRMFGEDDHRLSILRDFERAMTEVQRSHGTQNGGEEMPPAGWYQARTGYVYDEEGNKKRDGSRWQIDRVVDWSRTARGGKQYELFNAEPGQGGCVRWGFCDTGKDGDE